MTRPPSYKKRGGSSSSTGKEKSQQSRSVGRTPSRQASGPVAAAINTLTTIGPDTADMICDPPNPGLLCSTPADQDTISEPMSHPNTPYHAEENSRLPASSFNNVKGCDFAKFAEFLFSSCEEGQGDYNHHIRFTATHLIRFLERGNEEEIAAASLEITELKETHSLETRKLVSEYEERENYLQAASTNKMQKLMCEVQGLSKKYDEAQVQVCDLQGNLSSTLKSLQESDERGRALNFDIEAKKKQIIDLQKCKEKSIKDAKAKEKMSRKELLLSEERLRTCEREVRNLKSNVEEKETTLKDMVATGSKLKATCEKLEFQLLSIERKTAEQSTTSGSYTDNHANPSMLETAAKNVQAAVASLGKVLLNKMRSTNWLTYPQNCDGLLAHICHAGVVFTRPAQVKHAWEHWICSRMFEGFENVFFGVDDLQMSSPLDPIKHTSVCYMTYLKAKAITSSELLGACTMFQAFCIKKYAVVLPTEIYQALMQVPSDHAVVRDSHGRFPGDDDVYLKFLDVSKAVWLLHKLAFSFDPPASIFRVARGTPFDKQYHDSVVSIAEDEKKSQEVALMITPGFRVRNTLIRSEVFLNVLN